MRNRPQRQAHYDARCPVDAPDDAAVGAKYSCPHGVRYQLLPGFYTDALRWQAMPQPPSSTTPAGTQ